MDWTVLLARAARSWLSYRFIEELCPQPEIIEIVYLPRQITVVKTSTILINAAKQLNIEQSLYKDPSFLQPPLIFADVPGLSMHVLSFLSIITALLAILFIFTFILCGLAKHRSQHRRVHQETSSTKSILIEQEYVHLDVTTYAMSRMMKITKSQMDNMKLEMEQLKGTTNVYITNLKNHSDAMLTEYNKLEQENSSLKRDMAELSREYEQMKNSRAQKDMDQDTISELTTVKDRLEAQIKTLLELRKKDKATIDILTDRDAENTLHLDELSEDFKKLSEDYEKKVEICAKHEAEKLEALSKLQKSEEDSARNEQGSAEYFSKQREKIAAHRKADIQALEKAKNLEEENSCLKSEQTQLSRRLRETQNTLEEEQLKTSAHDRTTTQLQLTISDLQKRLKESAEKSTHTIKTEYNLNNVQSIEQISDEKIADLKRNLTFARNQLKEKKSQLKHSEEQVMIAQEETKRIRSEHELLKQQYAAQGEDLEDTRTQIETAEAVSKLFAHEMGVTATHVELSPITQKKIVSAKAVHRRGRALHKAFEDGAQSFKASQDRKTRKHSVATAETRIQLAKELKGGAIHLLKQEEKERMNRNLDLKSPDTNEPAPFNAQDIKEALAGMKNIYNETFVLSKIKDPKSLLCSLNLTLSSSLSTDIEAAESVVAESHNSSTTWWSAKTHYDPSSLFSHYIRNIEKKAIATHTVAIDTIKSSYDNKIVSVMNRLENYNTMLSKNDLTTKVATLRASNRDQLPFLQHMTKANHERSFTVVAKLIEELTTINQKIHNGTISNVINDRTGLKAMITKNGKEERGIDTSSENRKE